MSKFKFKDNRTFKEKLQDFFLSLLFWKGRKKGVIHTRDITIGDIKEIFLPKTFTQKYSYLGSIPWRGDIDIFDAIKPLVLLMDLEAKPWWCPRWFLRFLHVFGDDKSIVRVRNIFLSNLKRKITKGIIMWDYKTKWSNYDLRISIHAPEYLQTLSDNIQSSFYRKGYKEHLLDLLSREKELEGTYDKYTSICELERIYDEYQKSQN